MTPHDRVLSDWSEWKRLLLSNSEQAKADITEMRKDISSIKSDIVLLRYKASVYGAASGAIAVAILKMVFR